MSPTDDFREKRRIIIENHRAAVSISIMTSFKLTL